MSQSPREIQSEAIRPAAREQALGPGLYLVSTPIGNLRDITLRALDVLQVADRVLAEDTRVTGKLLSAYEISAKLQPYHDHNATEVRPGVLAALEAGERIALVSDAGTPLISDPGYKLVREVTEAGHDVFAIPGASALLAALCVSGLPTDRFTFAGFPPSKTGARENWLKSLPDTSGCLVFYEGASRLPALLTSLERVFGDREGVVCRELTKLHEETVRGRLGDLAGLYATKGAPKGELVVIVGPASEVRWDEARVDAALTSALARLRVKDAAVEVAEQSGWAKRDIYQRALALKETLG